MMSKSQNDEDVVGQMKGGLTFLKTQNRDVIVEFYTSKIGMKVWLEQPDFTILEFGNLLIGFHQAPKDATAETCGMYTFVFPSKNEVDDMYKVFENSSADGPPRTNDRYKIYQFFAKDPDGRNLEFQAFLHPLSVVSSKVDII